MVLEEEMPERLHALVDVDEVPALLFTMVQKSASIASTVACTKIGYPFAPTETSDFERSFLPIAGADGSQRGKLQSWPVDAISKARCMYLSANCISFSAGNALKGHAACAE